MIFSVRIESDLTFPDENYSPNEASIVGKLRTSRS